MSKYASGGDLAQLLAALRGARDPWSRIKLVASGARALAKLTPGQRVQLLRQLGLEGAEELAEAAVGGDPRMTDAMTQALRALEADPRRAQQLVAAIADPSSRRATLMGLGAHVLEAVTAPQAQQASQQAKARGGGGDAAGPSSAAPASSSTSSTPPASSRVAGAVAAAAGAAATRAQGGAAAARQAREARGSAVQPTMPGTPHPGTPQPSTPQPPQPSTPLPPAPGTPPVPPPSTPQPPQPSTPPPSTPATPATPAPPAAPPSTPTPASPVSAIAAAPAEGLATADAGAWEPAPFLFAESTAPQPPSIVALDLPAPSSSPSTSADARPAALATLRAWRRRLASDDLPRVGDAATLVAQQLRPGWAKRRALSALFAKQQPAAVDDALALVAQLGNAADRRWLLCDLAASRSWADDEWQRLLAAAAGPAERRRLAMRRARA